MIRLTAKRRTSSRRRARARLIGSHIAFATHRSTLNDAIARKWKLRERNHHV